MFRQDTPAIDAMESPSFYVERNANGVWKRLEVADAQVTADSVQPFRRMLDERLLVTCDRVPIANSKLVEVVLIDLRKGSECEALLVSCFSRDVQRRVDDELVYLNNQNLPLLNPSIRSAKVVQESSEHVSFGIGCEDDASGCHDAPRVQLQLVGYRRGSRQHQRGGNDLCGHHASARSG